MANIGGVFRGTATIEASTTPTIYNLSAPTANTEVSQVISANTKKILIRVRGNASLQLSFNSGESGTTYITIPSGSSYSEEGLKFGGILYVQTNRDSQIVEILEWT